MKVFLSHASADAVLAKQLAGALREAGFQVWDGSEVLPGDNPGVKLAEALEESEAMVVLLTPNSVHAPNVSLELGYALGKLDYKGRVIPVVAASPQELPLNDIPWILNRFKIIQLPQPDPEEGVETIAEALRAAA
jgi:hypothetical protein